MCQQQKGQPRHQQWSTTYFLDHAGQLLTRAAVVQGLHLAEEVVSLLGFCSELIHVPVGIELV